MDGAANCCLFMQNITMAMSLLDPKMKDIQ